MSRCAWPVQVAIEYASLLVLGLWHLGSSPSPAGQFLPAGPGLLLLWLLLRADTLRRQATGRTPASVFHWLESQLVGLGLSGTGLFLVNETGLSRLGNWLLWSLGALVVIEVVCNDRARASTLRWAGRHWRNLWPRAGELLVIVLVFWLWQRLTATAVPIVAFAWVAGAAGAVIGVTRSVPGLWTSLLAPAVVLPPLVWAYAGTPAGDPPQKILLLVGLTSAAAVLHRIIDRGPGSRSAGLAAGWILLLVGLWLTEPLLHAQASGGGDALWYSQVLADAIAQFRAGIFPPLVGQSPYAFNGAVFPGAVAPYYQVAGVGVNMLAGGALNVYAVQHLLASGSIIGGMFSAFLVLRRLTSAPRAGCVLLACLYGACPAWLGAIYSMDMYMTLLTMPWLPLVFAAAIGSIVRVGRGSATALAVPLALCWLAHPPVALWTSLAVGVMISWRWMQRMHPWRQEMRWFGATAGLFCLLAGPPFVMTLYTDRATDSFRFEYVMQVLAESWRVAWLPVSSGADRLGDQHLGWSLAVAGGVGLGLALRRRQRSSRGLFLAGGIILLLLIPLPFVQPALWRALPAPVKALTDNWPTQRLLPVLAALAATGAGTFLLRGLRHAGPAMRRTATLLLIGAAGWSGAEAAKFLERGRATTQTEEASRRRLLPENLILSRYAYHLFDRMPDHAAEVATSSLLRQRLLNPETLEPLASNAEAVRSVPVGREWILRSDQQAGSNRLYPGMDLMPGRQYFLEFAFSADTPPGFLRLRGERLDREYELRHVPGRSGLYLAEGKRDYIIVWTSGNGKERVAFSFVRRNPDDHLPAEFGRVQVREIATSLLPIEVRSESPFQAHVHASQSAWVETARMHVPGYRAFVDGRPAEVDRSPQGLVLVRVPSGPHELVLKYAPPLPVLVALIVSGLGWGLLAGFALRKRLSGIRPAPRPNNGRLVSSPALPT